MPKPHIHAARDVRQWGGKEEDYFKIHELMDSSKEAFAANSHRAATHNIWFVHKILPLIFGDTIVNSDGRRVSVKDIGEKHCLLDFGMKFIPTLQDWLENLQFHEWMNNGNGSELPSSAKEMMKNNQKMEFVVHE